MFDDLVKKAFARILVLNLKNHLNDPSNSIVRIFNTPLQKQDMMKAKKYEELDFMNFLNLD